MQDTSDLVPEILLLTALQDYLNFQQFKQGQLEAASAILTGNDVVDRMPTSGGKSRSLCYVLPCLCLPGLTIVISPLVSLMNEQVRNVLCSFEVVLCHGIVACYRLRFGE